VTIAIRTDSSLQIGIGHVMRCLALATGLRAYGYKVVFVCREYDGHSAGVINDSGFECLLLNAREDPRSEIEHLFDVDAQERDAMEMVSVLKINNIEPALCVVDHYGFDRCWHKNARKYVETIMVIDDSAVHEHDCDLLLDQTYKRDDSEYKSLVNNDAVIMCGSRYALLRNEFYLLRREAENFRKTGKGIRRVLVSLGGGGNKNIVAVIIRGLEIAFESPDVEIDLVIYSNSRYLSEVQALVNASHLKINMHIDCTEMARLILNADLAIGAAGTSSWERCCLGLPTLLLVVAENQRDILHKLSSENVVVSLGDVESIDHQDVAGNIQKLLLSPDKIQQMTANSFSVCDGLGVQRVVKNIAKPASKDGLSVDLVRATADDSKIMYQWQCNFSTRKYARNARLPAWSEHQSWFKLKMNDPGCYLYMLSHDEKPSGVLRLDRMQEKNTFEVSILIDPAQYGRGLAKLSLKLIRLYHPEISIVAHVLSDNIASQKLFEDVGYQRENDDHFVSRPNMGVL